MPATKPRTNVNAPKFDLRRPPRRQTDWRGGIRRLLGGGVPDTRPVAESKPALPGPRRALNRVERINGDDALGDTRFAPAVGTKRVTPASGGLEANQSYPAGRGQTAVVNPTRNGPRLPSGWQAAGRGRHAGREWPVWVGAGRRLGRVGDERRGGRVDRVGQVDPLTQELVTGSRTQKPSSVRIQPGTSSIDPSGLTLVPGYSRSTVVPGS